jgi:transposase
MSVVYQKDKRSGITYAYESNAWWDKEKKQSRSKRTLIGRLDEATGNIIPTDGRCRKDKVSQQSATESPVSKRGPVPNTGTSHLFYGATYLLDSISDSIGITRDLELCFPNDYKQILSIAYYLILENNNPLYRFEKWGITHHHPYGKDISSPRSSELFASITDEAVAQLFRLQGKRRIEKEYWAYDSTSISSYSEMLNQIQYGKNKENDRLAQLNLLLVFGEKSGLPFYYRKLAGNIPDVKTVKSLLADLDVLGLGKIKLVMDRGFYSEANINGLYRDHMKFLIGVRISLTLVRKELDAVYDDIRQFQNYEQSLDTYGYTVPIEWTYTQDRPNKGDTITEKRRMYLHLYYNIDKGAEDERNFDNKISKYYNELISGEKNESHEKDYQKFFEIKKTPKRGIQVTVNNDAILEAKRYFGYFALASNEKMDAFTALNIYRMKDIVEKAFGNIKERLNMRRLLVSSERSLDGKLFVEFVALIFISYINKKMQEQRLYKDYTMQQLLDKLDVIECFSYPGHELRVGEVLEKQKDLYIKLGVMPPALL